MGIRLETLTGPAIAPAISAVAELRIAVFREWPYLYEGTLDYERGYLAEFAGAPAAAIVAARDGDRIVGVATCAPLAGHTPQFVPLFEAHGLDPARVFYFGESVLLPAYRGAGLGHRFFDAREAHATASVGAAGGYTHTAFCAVVRDPADPRRPPGYRPLDGFWHKRGYRPVEGMLGHYSWREIGQQEETEKAMQFWLRPLP